MKNRTPFPRVFWVANGIEILERFAYYGIYMGFGIYLQQLGFSKGELGIIQSIFLTGDRGEYELLAYHYPLIGSLVKSDILINWDEKVPIKGGVVKFFANECVIMVEEEIAKVGNND